MAGPQPTAAERQLPAFSARNAGWPRSAALPFELVPGPVSISLNGDPLQFYTSGIVQARQCKDNKANHGEQLSLAGRRCCWHVACTLSSTGDQSRNCGPLFDSCTAHAVCSRCGGWLQPHWQLFHHQKLLVGNCLLAALFAWAAPCNGSQCLAGAAACHHSAPHLRCCWCILITVDAGAQIGGRMATSESTCLTSVRMAKG